MIFHTKARRHEGQTERGRAGTKFDGPFTTFETFTEGFTAKIHEQPEGLLRQTQVGEQLFCMNRCGAFDRLHFDNEPIVHNEISPESVRNGEAVEFNRDRLLAFDSQTDPFETCRKNRLIDALQEARPELFVNVETAVNRLLCKFFEVDHYATLCLRAFV